MSILFIYQNFKKLQHWIRFWFFLKKYMCSVAESVLSDLNLSLKHILLADLQLQSFLAGIDIEWIVKDSIKIFNHTPPSAASRRHDNSANRLKAPEEEKFLNLPVSIVIDDYGKDGGPHFTQCMIGICPLATHSYQNLQLQHKILTTATIDLGRCNFIVKSTRILLGS